MGRPRPVVGRGGDGRSRGLDGVGQGFVLAGRYRLEERLQADSSGSQWRAVDQTLERRVVIRVVDAAHPRAEDILDAARRAALAEDPRLVRILDVGSQGVPGGHATYIVSEHVNGKTLAETVTAGPLPAETARRLVGEASQALARAAGRGLHHLRLDPSCVFVTADGSVKVAGTAVAAAVAGIEPETSQAAERTDAVGLVSVLYAAITGRWPGGEASRLAEAPRVNGRAAPPGDLVAAVPNDLDTLCTVTLGPNDDGPQSPAELAEQLAPWARSAQLTDPRGLSLGGPDRPPPRPAPKPGGAPRRPVAGPADLTEQLPTTPFGRAASPRHPRRPSEPPGVLPAAERNRRRTGGAAPAAVATPPGTAAPGTPASPVSPTTPATPATAAPAAQAAPPAAAPATSAPAPTTPAPATSAPATQPPAAEPVAAPSTSSGAPAEQKTPAPATSAPAAAAGSTSAADRPAADVPAAAPSAPASAPGAAAAASAALTAPVPVTTPDRTAARTADPAADVPPTTAGGPGTGFATGSAAAPAAPPASPGGAGHDLFTPAAGNGAGYPGVAGNGYDETPFGVVGTAGGRGPWTGFGTPNDGEEYLGPFLPPAPLTRPPRDQSQFVLVVVAALVVVGLIVALWSLRDFGEGDGDPVVVPSPSAVASGAPSPSATPSPSVTPSDAATASPSPTPSVQPEIAGLRALDPLGDDEENDGLLSRASDGDDGTEWRSSRYRTVQFGGLKDGLGLAVRLEESAPVTEVRLDTRGSGGTIELRTADGPEFEGSTLVATGSVEDGEIVLRPTSPVTSEYLVVWVTRLPEVDGQGQLYVSEITVR